jgi:hypothetical protein
MKFKLIFLVIAFLATLQVSGQDSPDEIVEKFFTKYKEDGSDEALDYLYDLNDWVSKDSDDIIALKLQMRNLTEDYVGKYYGYEHILDKHLSDCYELKSFVIKYGRQPLRFVFQFYKPNDIWIFHGFSYDANLTEEIKESARLHNNRLH